MLLCTRKKKVLICPLLLPGHTTCISNLPADRGPGVLVSCVLPGGWQAGCTTYRSSLPHREAPSTHKTYSRKQRELHLLLSLDRGVSSGQDPLTGVGGLTNLRKSSAREERELPATHRARQRRAAGVRSHHSSARGCCPAAQQHPPGTGCETTPAWDTAACTAPRTCVCCTAETPLSIPPPSIHSS